MRNWSDIKKLILNGKLESKLQKIIFQVFESLAIAEGKVHGINPEHVHFHEIGAIILWWTLWCLCCNKLFNAFKVYCNKPTLGSGFVQTEHGNLSIPTPSDRTYYKK